MPVRYHETFEIITPESAEHGEAAKTGFNIANGAARFRDLVSMLEGAEPSCSPLPSEPHASIWFTHYGEADFRTGDAENTSIHAADQRAARYMLLAWRYANGQIV
jgi:hypothetical protein